MNPVRIAFNTIKEEQIYLPVRRATRIQNYFTVESFWGPIKQPGARKEVIVAWQGKKESQLILLPDYLYPVKNRSQLKTREDIRNYLILAELMPPCTYKFTVKYWAEYELPYIPPVPTLGTTIVRCFETKQGVLGFPTIALNNTGRWKLFIAKNGIPEDQLSEVELIDLGWVTQKFLDSFSALDLSKMFKWMKLPDSVTLLFYQALSPVDERGNEHRVHIYNRNTNILSPDGGYLVLTRDKLTRMMRPEVRNSQVPMY